MVKKQSLTDKAYSAIKAEIIAGHISPNNFIDLPQIEEQLGMSRTPIREAMLRLQTEKIVEIMPKQGIRILPFSVKELDEFHQIISSLELQAVGNICRRHLTRTDIMPVLYALSSMENAVKARDTAAWAEANETFHRGLFILNGNSKLMETGLGYRDVIQRALTLAFSHLPMAAKERSLRNHNQLKEVILAGDEVSARNIFLEHCDWIGNQLHTVLAEREITSL
ncbi:GntR family transcriptional regulator [Sneathiella marina]|uniref:GntR family transcriptional regulator n=1 Tax=Sneathiella marina TaxID=2950108 RepID=A0ABY4WAH0_9PROT|nr:GntR family transcriptional regulator [Sneathiella marina]USG63143.1 GntR family transcriptional regulator [Sneathiella marina]